MMEAATARMSFESVYGVVATAENAAVELSKVKEHKARLLQGCREAMYSMRNGHFVDAHDDLKRLVAEIEGAA